MALMKSVTQNFRGVT